ncbi:MAG: phosphatase PAP2 family protein [Prevotella sp.]|nr:phosphatase PAP2 family protein [Prevotella sp.]MBR1546657.1 phosphatase PAP2 family protein [Prevotella sp.]
MRRTLWMLAAILTLCGTNVKAENKTSLESLTLTAPEMTPTLTSRQMDTYHPELSLRMSVMPGDHAPWAKENWTWMRTNPGVTPYKFMDDLTFVGVPLFVAGIIAKSEKRAFRQNDGSKHVLLTDFKTGIDDYAQFFGPAMTVGLKLGGVEGRSDWGRLLASSALSYGIMAGFVNGIKYTAKEMRPDGSTANSWPSGHTATAFVGATILHKEYGLTRSPWYSIAGYGVATATGVMRVLNNRHWISDVLSGAGIGIMSGELAYAISDFLFKGKGLLRGDGIGERSVIDNPSFFSISMGIGFGSRDMDFNMQKFDFNEDGDDNFNLKFGASTAVAAEGAYFFNKYIGVGGRLRVNSSLIKGWDGIENYAWSSLVDGIVELSEMEEAEILNDVPSLIEDANFTIKSDHLTEFAVDLGVYFNLPLSKRFALGSKLLVGRSIMQEIDLDATVSGGVKELNYTYDDVRDEVVYNGFTRKGNYETEWDYFTVSANNTMKFGTGISLTYAYKDNFAWKVFLDYDYSRKTYTMTYNPGEFLMDALDLRGIFPNEGDFSESQSIKKNRHTFVLGGSFVISF